MALLKTLIPVIAVLFLLGLLSCGSSGTSSTSSSGGRSGHRDRLDDYCRNIWPGSFYFKRGDGYGGDENQRPNRSTCTQRDQGVPSVSFGLIWVADINKEDPVRTGCLGTVDE